MSARTHGAIWVALVLLLQTTACVIHEYGGPSHAGGCPPGHVWSDGRCHEHGKGHDKHKHEGHQGDEH